MFNINGSDDAGCAFCFIIKLVVPIGLIMKQISHLSIFMIVIN